MAERLRVARREAAEDDLLAELDDPGIQAFAATVRRKRRSFDLSAHLVSPVSRRTDGTDAVLALENEGTSG
jgi:hypothetical protein